MRPVSEPMSPIMGGRSMSVRFDALQIEIEALKNAGARGGGTLNDAYVAAVLGGLGRYHRHHGVELEELRMTMPINVRAADDRGKTAGNLFAPARFAVPLAIDDPIERMAKVHALVQEQRAEPAYARMGGISTVLYGLGPAIFTRLSGSMLKAIDFVTSNVPGPKFPVYSSGSLVERNIPFGPLGGAGLNVTLYSYNGIAEIGINADRAAVPDGDVLTGYLRESLDEFAALARGTIDIRLGSELQRLRLQELLDAVGAVLASVAGLLVATERRLDVEAATVDVDRARAHPAGDLHGPLVGAPHAAGQAVEAVVGDGDRHPRRRRRR